MVLVSKAGQWEAMREAASISEGRWLAEYRKQGRDMFFQWYLVHQRVRILAAYLARAIASPLLRGHGDTQGYSEGGTRM